jgi:hypothetical protein
VDDVNKYGITIDYTRDVEGLFVNAFKAAIRFDTEYHLLNLHFPYGNQEG